MIEQYFETIPAGKLTFELDGVIFEAPRGFDLITDDYVYKVASLIVRENEAKRLGALAFFYRDTKGLREDCIFDIIRKQTSDEEYIKMMEGIILEGSIKIKFYLKEKYKSLRDP